MLGIKEIASYIPENRISNYEKQEQFQISSDFIENTIGVRQHARMADNENASDLCIQAYSNLEKKIAFDHSLIDCCIIVTQNPDFKLPHTSAIVHGKLGFAKSCASFDISLGCSGYIYGLSTIISFMQMNNLHNGLLFTADPYSKIIDESDKNTSLIFGDAASVTLITTDGSWCVKGFSFGSDGSGYQDLICRDGLFHMNGRSVFTFAASIIPPHINNLMAKHGFVDKDIDKYILHQGSKYIVDTICKRLRVTPNKVPFDMANYGNTVSSSIPLILEKELLFTENRRLIATGFGVGLSWASAILERIEE